MSDIPAAAGAAQGSAEKESFPAYPSRKISGDLPKVESKAQAENVDGNPEAPPPATSVQGVGSQAPEPFLLSEESQHPETTSKNALADSPLTGSCPRDSLDGSSDSSSAGSNVADEDHEAIIKELVAQREEKLEEAKQLASQNVADALQKLIEVANLARTLYGTMTSDTKELMMETFRSIDSQVKQSHADVQDAKQRASRLRQTLATCESEMDDVRSLLQACVAVLDLATQTIQKHGDLPEANAASQKASEVLKSLHRYAEQAAQAQADLAVMSEYERQVEQRIKHHQHRMSELESAQLQAMERAGTCTSMQMQCSFVHLLFST